MSVTIISTLPNQTQATAADSAAGTDNLAAGSDFASLLFGQLAPIVAEALPNAVAPVAVPASETTATDDALLLAGLGIAPQEAGGAAAVLIAPAILPEAFKHALPEITNATTNDIAISTDTASFLPPLVAVPQEAAPNVVALLPDAGKIDKVTTDLASTVQTPLAIGANPKPEGETEALRSGPEISRTPTVDNKPAKLAVDPLAATRAEQVISTKPSADTLPNAVTALPGNATGIIGNLPAQGTVSLSIPIPVRDPAWAGDFSQKIMWLATNDKQTAQLSLTPPQMGPIEVSVNLDKGHAMVSFVSANGDTRQAIESALPRLREMFATAGIELGQTNVSAQSSGQQSSGWEGGRSTSPRMADRTILVTDSASALQGRAFSISQGSGLIDIFA